jgi:hypothetical protein
MRRVAGIGCRRLVAESDLLFGGGASRMIANRPNCSRADPRRAFPSAALSSAHVILGVVYRVIHDLD